MVYVLPDYIIIANLMYAKNVKYLDYDEIEKYKVILYQTITKKYKYIMFDYSLDNYIKIYNQLFIKQKDGIICFYDLDDKVIEKINSIYPNDIREMIKKTYNIYQKTNKTLVNKIIP